LPLFEEKHPGCIGLFCFDQSSNHNSFKEDALVATKMNLGPGGKNIKHMRDGYFLKEGEKVIQKMEDVNGVPKGIKAVLIERGLWPDKGLNLDCKECPEGKTDCCARKMMGVQPDFVAQKSALIEIIEERGHMVEFYPKFHCETNFIERVWGEAKRVARKECDYSFASLRVRVPLILNQISLIHIRNYHRKAWHYMHAYSLGLGGKAAEWAVKKYKCHRKISSNIEKEMEQEGIIKND